MIKLFGSYIGMFVFSFNLTQVAHANMQCQSLFEYSSEELTVQTMVQLQQVQNGERVDTESFKNQAIHTLVEAIEHYSFKDSTEGALRQAREYLRDKGRLSTRETLLSSIIEFNLRDENSNAHIERAIEILRSISVPLRRRPEFNWHLAEFYHKLGDKERAYNLILYIMHSARLQPKTLVYFYSLHRELDQPALSAQTERVLQRNRFNLNRNLVFNADDWGPYLRQESL